MPNCRILVHELCPQLLKLGITCFGHYNMKAAQENLQVHDHGSCYEICYLDKGIQPYYIYENDCIRNLYNLHGGEVFITRPYERHSTGEFNQRRGCLYWMQIDPNCETLLGLLPENAEMLKNALASFNHPIVSIPHSTAMHLTEAYGLLCAANDERFFRACQHLALFITEIAAHNKKIADNNSLMPLLSPNVLKVVTYIEENLLNPNLNVQAVAEHLYYSRAYVMTLFRKEMGVTIHEYILQKKIEYSLELLEQYSVTETSFLLHFSSSQHFSKVFKDRMSLTPHEYMILREKDKLLV